MVENLSEKEMTQACKGNVIPGRVAMKVLDLYSKVSEISGEDGDPSVERSLKRAKVVCRDRDSKPFDPGSGEDGK